MAAQIGSSYYVGPDNGTITLWLERTRGEGQATRFVRLDRPAFWRAEISAVFHGRDVFSPVAGHLAAGVRLEELGSAMDDPVLLDFPRPRRVPGGMEGEIIHIDHFGNAASNIMLEDLAPATGDRPQAEVRIGATSILGLVRTFGERRPGEVVALIGSTGNLVVSVVNGSASAQLGLHVGQAIHVLTAMPHAKAPQ
jgi:S-adenosylmethionine hydrolase